jgi:dTDP-4-amino-4,6-dideoxygalactose transaminase
VKVPILDLVRQYESLKPEMDAAVARVLVSGRFILGPEVEGLEKEVAAFCGAKHAIGLASGTDALLLSLRALGVGEGDQVLLPSFTFFATAGVVHNARAVPVFADIDPKTFNLDPASVRRILADKRHAGTVKAMIPVHLYGQMADMDELVAISNEHKIAIVEDAAQAIGAEYKGKKAGTIGRLGCFSFFPTKNLGCYGDGGMVITNDDALAESLRILRVHGSKPKYFHRTIGYNSRLDALQAAVLRTKLPHLADWSQARARIADRYDPALAGTPGITTPPRFRDRTHIFHQYTIRVAGGRRDALQRHLKDREIGTEVYYPLPLHLQDCFRSLGYKPGDLPESERASQEALSLPLFPEIRPEEQDWVVQAIREFAG